MTLTRVPGRRKGGVKATAFRYMVSCMHFWVASRWNFFVFTHANKWGRGDRERSSGSSARSHLRYKGSCSSSSFECLVLFPEGISRACEHFLRFKRISGRKDREGTQYQSFSSSLKGEIKRQCRTRGTLLSVAYREKRKMHRLFWRSAYMDL